MDQQSEPGSQTAGRGTPRQGVQRPRTARWTGFALALLVALGATLGPRAVPAQSQVPSVPIDHVVVIYLENRSFDNLYGLSAGADGLANAVDVPLQTDLDGTVYVTLPQPVDTYQQPAAADPRFPADLPNRPFDIGSYVPPAEKTGDLIHAYYRQQYQIN